MDRKQRPTNFCILKLEISLSSGTRELYRESRFLGLSPFLSFPPLFLFAHTVILELPKYHLKFWNQCLSLSLAVLMTTCFLYWRDQAGESLNRPQILESVPRKHSRRRKERTSLREAETWGFYCKFLIYKQTGIVTDPHCPGSHLSVSTAYIHSLVPESTISSPWPWPPQSSSSASFLSDSTHIYSQALADSPAAAGQLTESWSVIPGRVGLVADLRQQHSLLTLWPPGQAQD